jgi:hypothetical protein
MPRLFLVAVDCSAPGALVADTLLALAAQREQRFDVQLANASPRLVITARRLGLTLTEQTGSSYLTSITGFDVPLAHWLSTFVMGLIGGAGAASARVAVQPIAWRKWKSDTGFTPIGPIDVSTDVRTTASRAEGWGEAFIDAITLLRRQVETVSPR